MPKQNETIGKMAIKFADMLREMESSTATFSLRWVKCDLTRNTGGQIVQMEGLQLRRNEITPKKRKNKPSKPRKYSPSFKIYDTSEKRYITIYKRLIIEYNGQNVIY